MEKKMSKGMDNKFLNNNLHTCVLKVNIHCDGCLKKVKKLLHKIDGVYDTNIDADQGKVTVIGSVDSATLIKKLEKAGKHAEEWPTKGPNNNKNNLTNQLQKFNLENAKIHHNGKSEKGVEGKEHKKKQEKNEGKGLKDLLSNLKDLKFSKNKKKKKKKSVKFQDPSKDEDSDGGSDESNDSEDGDDDVGVFGDELLNNLKKMKGMNGHEMGKDKNGQNGGLKGKKSGLVQVINKVKNGNKKDHVNQSKADKNDAIRSDKSNGMNTMGHGYNGINFGPNMGPFPAVQGLPAGTGGVPTGHYGGPIGPQEMNPYQQQYMQALMQQQQQKRMMINGEGGAVAPHSQMVYGYGYGYGQPSAYAPNVQSSYNMFSDENADGCSIM